MLLAGSISLIYMLLIRFISWQDAFVFLFFVFFLKFGLFCVWASFSTSSKSFYTHFMLCILFTRHTPFYTQFKVSSIGYIWWQGLLHFIILDLIQYLHRFSPHTHRRGGTYPDSLKLTYILLYCYLRYIKFVSSVEKSLKFLMGKLLNGW